MNMYPQSFNFHHYEEVQFSSHPHSWYPVARKKRRKVTLHVGPTNSGKTHSALKQLELSLSGKLFIMFRSTLMSGKFINDPCVERQILEVPA